MFAARRICAVTALLATLVATAAPTRAQTPADRAEYARRFKALDKKDAEGFAQLGLWCREKKLETYAKLCFKKALKADKGNATAHRALGHVEYEGEWLTAKEADARRAEIAARARAAEKAKVRAAAKKRGSPLVPPDEEGEQRRVAGSFKAGKADAQKLLDTFCEIGGFEASDWKAARSPHVRVVVADSQEEAERLCQIGEYAYRKLSWVTFGKVDSRRFGPWGGVMEFVLADDPELEASIDLVQKRFPALIGYNDFANMPREVRKNSLEFAGFLDPPVHLHWNPENRGSTVANSVGRAVVGSGLSAKFAEPKMAGGEERPFSMMNWLLEGAGVWASVHAVGINDLYRIDGTRYAGDDIVKKGMGIPWCDLAHEIATTGSCEGTPARTFPQLCRSKLRTWQRGDLVQSFAFFDWLVRERKEDYRALVRVLRNKSFLQGFFEVFGTPEEKVKVAEYVQLNADNKLMELFEGSGLRIHEAWRKWAVEAYKVGGSAYSNFEDAPFRVEEDEESGAKGKGAGGKKKGGAKAGGKKKS